MAKATLTIAIGGEYQGRDAVRKAESELKALRESARQVGGSTSEIMRFGDSFVDIGSSMEVCGQKITDIGTKITKLSAPIAAVGAASVKLAADYENSVAKVYTIMDKSAMSTEKMSQTILDLSTATGKSATELADATYQALSASVSTEKVAGFVEKSVDLAKAGFTSTTSAVDALTTVINAYKLSADDAAEISDKLVQAQNDGKTTVDELAQSMGTIIPTASALNVNLDNVLSSYAIMTKQGIKTTDATTALKNTLSELSDEGSTVAGILMDKTGKSFGQLMDEGMSLGDVLSILYESVDGNGEAFKNLWGNMRAGTGALAIASAGADGFNSEMGKMEKSTGNVASALEDLQTPSAKANKAINAVKNTGIQLGEEIIGAAVPSLEKLGDMAQDLYKWFGELDEGTKQNIVRIGALVVAAGPAITVFGKLYGGVGSLVKGLGQGLQKIGAFSAAMKTTETAMLNAGATTVSFGDKVKGAASKTGMLTNATGLLKGSLAMLGVGAAVAMIGWLVESLREWKEHTDQVEKATTGLESALGAAGVAYDGYAASVDGATKSLEGHAVTANDALESQAQLAGKMTETWSDVGTNAAMVDRYAQTISELATGSRLTADEQVKLQAAVDGFNQITGAGIEVIDIQNGKLSTTREAILGVAEAYKEEAKAAAAKEILTELYEQQVKDEVALKAAQEELNQATQEYTDALSGTMEQQAQAQQKVEAAQQKYDELSASLNSVNKSIDDHVDMLSSIPTKFQSVEDAMASCGMSIESLGNVTDEQMAAIKSNFDGTLQSIYDACVEQGVNIPIGLSEGIGSGVVTAAGSMTALATACIDAAKSMFESHSPSRVMFRIGEDVDTGLANGIGDGEDVARKSMEGVARAVEKAVSGLPDFSKRTGDMSGSGLAGAIGARAGDVAGAARSLYGSAANGIGETPGTFEATGRDASAGFSDAIGRSSAYGEGRSLAYTARDGLGAVDAYNAGWNFAAGFSSGMNGPDIWSAAWNIGCSALSAIRSALGISSPSKEAMRVGEFFGEGAVLGMRNTERAIAAESNRLSDLMDLEPTPYGTYAVAGATAGQAQQAARQFVFNVTLNVSARSAAEGKAVGMSLAESLYQEIARQDGSRL